MVLNLRFNKRGQGLFITLIFGIVVLFALGLIWVTSFFTQSLLNTQIQAEPSLSNESKAVMQEQTNAMPSVFDSGVGFVMVLIFIITMGMAYKAPSNPVLLIALLLVIVALGVVGMIFSNVWDNVMSDSSLSNYAVSFPITNFLLTNFLVVVLVISFMSLGMYLFGSGGYG
jgi:hypothetical protein